MKVSKDVSVGEMLQIGPLDDNHWLQQLRLIVSVKLRENYYVILIMIFKSILNKILAKKLSSLLQNIIQFS